MSKRYGCAFGLNYTGRTDIPLNGCQNDSAFWADQMSTFDSVIKQISPNNTCQTMQNMVTEQLSKANSGDLVVITYSGHGTTVPPGIQSWVPDDFDWNNPKTWFTYDMLDQIILTHERRGVLVVVISDSCHSRADPRLHFRDMSMNPHPVKNRFLEPPQWIQDRTVSEAYGRNIITADQDDLLLSGCQKKQTSADAFINGQYWGAFTYAMKLALAHGPISYEAAVLKARVWLAANGYSQVPSADGAPESLKLLFFTPPPMPKEPEAEPTAVA